MARANTVIVSSLPLIHVNNRSIRIELWSDETEVTIQPTSPTCFSASESFIKLD